MSMKIDIRKAGTIAVVGIGLIALCVGSLILGRTIERKSTDSDFIKLETTNKLLSRKLKQTENAADRALYRFAQARKELELIKEGGGIKNE